MQTLVVPKKTFKKAEAREITSLALPGMPAFYGGLLWLTTPKKDKKLMVMLAEIQPATLPVHTATKNPVPTLSPKRRKALEAASGTDRRITILRWA